MRATLPTLALVLAGCVLDWSAGWPDAGARSEAGPEQGVADAHREARSERGDLGVPIAHEWIDVAPGDFVMGAPATVPCRVLPGEALQPVRLAHAFQIARTETTQGQFLALMGYTNLRETHLDRPIAKVNWHEATAYCNALSEREGRLPCFVCKESKQAVRCEPTADAVLLRCPGYRLPTEAEWEYAYRAGTATPFYLRGDGDGCSAVDAVAEQIGWYAANAKQRAQPVAQKRANAWGIHDLAGNVREWCADLLSREDGPAPPLLDPVGKLGPIRVLRGGSHLDPASALRASARTPISETFSAVSTGFRCVRTLPRVFSGVMNKITMPTKENEFALDLDGTTPKNGLGKMIVLLKTLTLDFQQTLDTDLEQGKMLVLVELHADSVVSSPRAIGQLHLGADTDGNADNNFSGGVLAVRGNSPPGLFTKGAIVAGAAGQPASVSLRGRIPFPLPLTLNAPANKVLTLSAARIEAQLTPGSLKGIVAGAVTQRDFDLVLIPAVAEQLTWALSDPMSPLKPNEKAYLATLLDINPTDGVITEAELRSNTLLMALINPDVDTDGDGKLDGYSMAVGFEAVPCAIRR